MTAIQARTLVLAGAFAVSMFLIPCAAVLRAQEVTDVPVSSASESTKDKVVNAIEGIKSGDISAAKEAVAFDRLLSYTLIRISDSWTLCKQEMVLAKECARQEAIKTAKDIFTKGKDAAAGQGREAILDALPLLTTVGRDDLSDTPSASASSAQESAPASDPNKPEKMRESMQERLSTPISSGTTDPAKARESIQDQIRGN